jgi:hypothetical protein
MCAQALVGEQTRELLERGVSAFVADSHARTAAASTSSHHDRNVVELEICEVRSTPLSRLASSAKAMSSMVEGHFEPGRGKLIAAPTRTPSARHWAPQDGSAGAS